MQSPAPVPRLWHFAVEYLLLLPLGAAIALLWVNTAPESYFRATFSLSFLVNDVAMVLFFGWVMKEVAEATAPDGMLSHWRRVLLPLAGAVGAALLPAVLFLALAPYLDEPRLSEGWPVVLVSDVAFGYFLVRLIFGRHPVVAWFVLATVCANAIGVAALAASGATGTLRPDLLCGLMAAALASALIFRRFGVVSFWPYVVVGGGLSWSALYLGGLTPALALVPIVPFLPHAPRDPGFFVDAAPDARDTLNRFELWCRHPAQAALFLFGLVNGGVPLQVLYWTVWTIPLLGFLAKPIGLIVGVALAVPLGLILPRRIGVPELAVVGLIASIGFTGALFFATASVGPGPTLSTLKMSALLTVLGAPAALVAAAALRVGRFGR